MKRNKLIKTLALTLAVTSLGSITPSIAKAEGQAYWTKSNSNWYYIDSTGKSTTGWINDNGNWYYLGSDGVMKTGWIYDSGNWYYSWSNGQMATDTTIDGYYINASGAWTTSKNSTASSSNTALTPDDINKHHTIRGDIGTTADEIATGQQLSSSNISIDYESEMLLKGFSDNIAKGRITIDEARNSCIGKVLNGKYRIANITFLNEVFPTSSGTFTENQIRTIKGSSLYSYNPSSYYKYDKYMAFACGNERSNEWEAMRLVVEFEAL